MKKRLIASLCFDSVNVSVNGAYDVGMESSGNCERESRGNGDHTASADNSRNGDQSEVFISGVRGLFIKRRIWIPWLLLAQARLTATVFMLCLR